MNNLFEAIARRKTVYARTPQGQIIKGTAYAMSETNKVMLKHWKYLGTELVYVDGYYYCEPDQVSLTIPLPTDQVRPAVPYDSTQHAVCPILENFHAYQD